MNFFHERHTVFGWKSLFIFLATRGQRLPGAVRVRTPDPQIQPDVMTAQPRRPMLGNQTWMNSWLYDQNNHVPKIVKSFGLSKLITET